MKPFHLFLLLLLLRVSTHADSPYHVRHLSERELTITYANLLLDACRHADRVWHDPATDPHAGYWGTGRSDQMNEGIRAISGMVLASGALLKYSDGVNASERRSRLRQATRAIRYAVSTHRTGTEKCTDGKPWGGSWQSAMWTATLTFGAWLIWDEMFQTILLPSAEPAYPQGMDWELHGLSFINLYASLASYQKDPLAAPFGADLPAIHARLAGDVPRRPCRSRLQPRLHPPCHLRRTGRLRLSGPQNLRRSGRKGFE